MNLSIWKPLFFIFLFSFIPKSYAGWIDLNTGINDDLTGVVFNGNKGVVCGKKGLYITGNGGIGAASWSRYNITGNTADSLLYNRTRFYHAYAETGSNIVLACGMDTINQSPVVFKISLLSFVYSIPYQSPTKGCLKKIGFSPYNNHYFAVGDSGLIVKISNDGSNSSKVNTPFKYNLTAIGFSDISSQITVAGPGIFLKGILSSNTDSIDSITYTGIASNMYTDMVYTGGKFFLVGSGYYFANLEPLDYGNYDLGPLNARSMTQRGGYHYIGTDHGIFKSAGSENIIEWQPTSANATINCIWANSNTQTIDLYACGNGGTLLSTTDDGGLTKPFVKLNLAGGCVNGYIDMKASKGTTTGCQWYVNNVLVNNQCTNFSRTFPTIGTYTVKLTVSNGSGLYDTSTQLVNIVDPPKRNLPYNIDQTLLCKEEPVMITVDSSQSNVYYSLRSFTLTTSYGSSPSGNGSSISLNSTPIKQSGLFYLKASSTLANCTTNFTDTINITVERTKASFHKGLINAKTNEPVNFYQNCTDAQHYAWTFHKNAVPSVSSDTDPVVRFGSLDSTNVKLICWSDSGCYDTAEASGPVMYTELNHPDSFYSMVNNDPETEWTGQMISDITQMIPAKTGYLVCGNFNETVLNSYYGTSSQLSQRGGYLAKYNDDGTLKWIVRSTSYWDESIYKSVVEDPKTGEVYIAVGRFGGVFYDNSGKAVSTGGNGKYTLIKIDSIGKLIWYLNSTFIGFDCLSLDRSGNIISAINGQNIYLSVFSINGIVTDTIKPGPLNQHDGRILKISPQGKILWNAAVFMNNVNADGFLKTGCDSMNNIYITGSYEVSDMIYYAPSGAIAFVLPGIQNNYGGRAFLAKYDSLGSIQWAIRSRTLNALNERTIPNDMLVDKAGNVYLTGQNEYHNGTAQVFENTDSTTTSLYVGPFFLAKINNSGKCTWMVGGNINWYTSWSQITLNKNNEIVAAGMIPSMSLTPNDIGFSSMDNNNITQRVYTPGCFVVMYDTAGNVKRALSNGSSPNTALNFFNNFGFFQKANGAYYLAQHLNIYENSIYKNFGTSVTKTTDWDGMVSKFYENWRPDYTSTNTKSNISVIQCDSFYAPSGKLFVSTGLYDDIIPNVAGGDSIIRIDLTLLATKSFVSIKGCDSVAHRGTTYYTSGNYRQTLLNSNNCDSTIYIEATVGKTTYDTLFIFACDSFVSSNTTFKNSGWYKQELKSYDGCDSTLMLNLDIHYSTKSYVNLTGCDSVSFRNISYDTSGVYTQILTNTEGCDSTIYITANVGKTTHDTLYLTVCDSITITNTTYRNSGWYNLAYLTALGCDSLVTVFLDIRSTTHFFFAISTCDSFEMNGNTYTQDGLYKQILVNSMGCDSILELALNILNDHTAITLSGCDSVEINSIHYYTSGIYNQHFINSYGCDSLISINLTITNIDTTVRIANDTLISNTPNATYQWINCKDGSAIPGATQRRFVPTFSGSFKVIATSNGCTDTSDCHMITKTGLNKAQTLKSAFRIYPNPNTGNFSLALNTAYKNSKAIIHNIAGQVVFEKNIEDSDREIPFNLTIETGIYFIEVIDTSGTIIFYDKFIVLPQN